MIDGMIRINFSNYGLLPSLCSLSQESPGFPLSFIHDLKVVAIIKVSQSTGMNLIFKNTDIFLIELLLICFFIFNFTGCGEKKNSEEFTTIEVELISQFLDSIAQKNFNDSIFEWENPTLVSDSTYFVQPEPWLIDLYNRKYPEEDNLLINLIKLNKKSYFINKQNFDKINGLEIIADSEALYYYKRENKIGLGVGFYAYSISRPFIDETSNKAIIFIREFSEDWEEIKYVWYKKESDKWVVYDKINPNDWP